MNLINDHLDKNNMHHAYLIEGEYKEIFPEILEFMKEIKIETVGNPDFSITFFDSFKIEDARNLKLNSSEKGFSLKKKIYIISANNFLLEAQNTLLKMFEEPIEDTHFFIIIPNADILLKTLISRFYLIRTKNNPENSLRESEMFMSMSIKDRILFIKNLLADEKNTNEEEFSINTNTSRAKAIKFLNELEISLYNKYSKEDKKNVCLFEQIFKVREFLSQPGSSSKTLMESVALLLPIF
jgi:hypothetical protein